MGRIRWLRKSHCCRQNEKYSQLVWRRPEIGSQSSCTPNSMIRSRANQKSGVAKPTNTKTVVTLSNVEYWRVADSTPTGTARAMMSSISTTFRNSVTGRGGGGGGGGGRGGGGGGGAGGDAGRG